ncbi:hypothetical protein K458DRAFT_417135 [Lentithecium fluviatile CBS 122367]|uniref:Uncharacterized protein n=1 Tax=Lentithecium fluviatile CBS 122367 TaxID=1168545 RepID=A0A6G1J5Z8_9PLEO|nr:hypothetical protein K458DRAFT_417135 [Lentithecium fluviatile CBS 122367]
MSANTQFHDDLDLLLVSGISEANNHELIVADTVSISTSSTLSADSPPFQPVKSLHINTKGIPILSIPFQNIDLEINITNDDGTKAYTSTRQRWNSPNSLLKDTLGRQRVATSYFFGPGRDPRLRILGTGDERAEIRSVSRWTSRTHVFVLPDGRRFEWRYRREKGCAGCTGEEDKRGSRALVLSLEGKTLAMLIRNEETRTTLRSAKWSAGSGGELVLGPEVGVEGGLAEDVVVASCLLMLKREVDRRRVVQSLVVVGAVAAEV